MPAGVVDREETEGDRHVTGTGLVFFGGFSFILVAVMLRLTPADATDRKPASLPACQRHPAQPQPAADCTSTEAHLLFLVLIQVWLLFSPNMLSARLIRSVPCPRP